ncbi:DUF1801 domain-containing protein [Terrimonas sp. NA20]|uniref:DUF1801 domain-containing protein n=1 Tax=Terrimonas ginsenosidimutans TaxID=2908004 RepID=A0ABS9KTE4_9BACT|nr:DUF1801 domain-containing protein [Terrimonas ginsenosidimutans]MCG2615614.1 DUF1801 domain-containing protein [Terrimonas ginsenosidimutans]
MRGVDDYIKLLPEGRKEICEKIREMIFSLVPEIEERLSFKMPFYHYFGMFMYFRSTKDGISVCFMRGKDLVELFPELQQNKRAIVASVLITSKADIYTLNLQEIILTAAAWNQEAKMLKKPMVNAVKKKSPARKKGTPLKGKKRQY